MAKEISVEISEENLKEDMQNKSGRHFPRITIIISVLLALSITAVFLGVYLGRKDTEPDKKPAQSPEATCEVDVAIIGAGVAGSYAAWRLSEHNLSVTVYEYSNRIGGRMRTVHLPGAPDINIELGAMRFVPIVHPLLNATLHAIQLPVVDFAQGMGGPSDVSMSYLRGVHMPGANLGGPGTPYKLKDSERKVSGPQLAFDLFKNKTSHGGEFMQTKDGYPLYKQSVQEAYTTMGVSQEAIRFIRDSFGFYGDGGDVSAASVIPADDPSMLGGISVKTIQGGMQTLPTALIQQFLYASKRHGVRKNAELRRITRRSDGSYTLTFLETQTTSGYTTYVKDNPEFTSCAKTVLLAIPRSPLEQIEWSGLRIPEVRHYVKHAVKDIPVSKIFLAYNAPWWRNTKLNFSHSITDLPNQQTYDFGTSAQSNISIILAAYVDKHESVSFWRKANSRGNITGYHAPHVDAAIGATDHLLDLTHTFLAELYNISVNDIPAPLGGVIANWDEYPYGAGWQLAMPGFLPQHVQDRMLQPLEGDQVYVMSNAFHRKGSNWSEEALDMVELALNKLNTFFNP